ncbi:MAG: hypothetical protein RL660_941 [Bacteroidota bacterium]|jgi:hypothetical protein
MRKVRTHEASLSCNMIGMLATVSCTRVSNPLQSNYNFLTENKLRIEESYLLEVTQLLTSTGLLEKL